MFFSTTKFRETVFQLRQCQGDFAILFDPNDTFGTSFNQIAVKPIAIAFLSSTEDPEDIVTHSSVLEMFEGYQPVVCINPAFFSVNRDRKVQGLILQEPKLHSKGFRYSPCRAFTKLDEKLTDMVIQARI